MGAIDSICSYGIQIISPHEMIELVTLHSSSKPSGRMPLGSTPGLDDFIGTVDEDEVGLLVGTGDKFNGCTVDVSLKDKGFWLLHVKTDNFVFVDVNKISGQSCD